MASRFSFSGWTSSYTPTDSLATLSSRNQLNPMTGRRQVDVAQSVYQNPQVPAALTAAVNELNMTQLYRLNNLTDWQQNLLTLFKTSGPNTYLAAEALRAASVQPGAHVAFGSAIENPQTAANEATAVQMQKAPIDLATYEISRNKTRQEVIARDLSRMVPGTREYSDLISERTQLQAALNNPDTAAQQLGRAALATSPLRAGTTTIQGPANGWVTVY